MLTVLTFKIVKTIGTRYTAFTWVFHEGKFVTQCLKFSIVYKTMLQDRFILPKNKCKNIEMKMYYDFKNDFNLVKIYCIVLYKWMWYNIYSI